jgi:hypothetical protein
LKELVSMRKWTRWEDWVAVVVGVVVALSTIWMTAMGASVALMLILGILLIASGVVNLARPGMVAMEWVQGALGILLFISPWVGGYSSQPGVAWVSWIGGAVTIIVVALAMQPMVHMPHRTVMH